MKRLSFHNMLERAFCLFHEFLYLCFRKPMDNRWHIDKVYGSRLESRFCYISDKWLDNGATCQKLTKALTRGKRYATELCFARPQYLEIKPIFLYS
jgi:hypothetical protein